MSARAFLSVTALFCLAGAAARAEEGWKYSLGPTFLGGFEDVKTFYTTALENQGYETRSSLTLPVGVSFTPYYALKNGSRLCIDVGPVSYLATSGGSFFRRTSPPPPR